VLSAMPLIAEFVRRDWAGLPVFRCRECAGDVLTVPPGLSASRIYGLCTGCGLRYSQWPEDGVRHLGNMAWRLAPIPWRYVWAVV
jgi:hypothetical protein